MANEQVRHYLQKIMEKGMVGHSFLFSGPSGVGKKQAAREFAGQLLGQATKLQSGNHPDLHILRPEGKASLHTMEALRLFQQEVFLPPNESDRKVFIIEEAERMLPTSANALLKTFEEPAKDTVIILVTDHAAILLPTILSRCRKILFAPEHKDAVANESLIALLQGDTVRYGDLQKVTRKIQEESEKRQEAILEEKQALLKDRDLSAVQRGALEKELEGEAAHLRQREAESLFTTLLYWYRDRHLEQLGVDPKYLLLPPSTCKRTLPTLSRVEEIIREGNLAIQRSYSLSLALESTLLKLGV